MKMLNALLAACLMPAAAWAGNKSVYTDLNLANCEYTAAQEGEGGYSHCKGYNGTDVFVIEGDLRTFVTYDDPQGAKCAARQTFSLFNSPGSKVEWRLKNGKPIATILRFSVQTEDAKATWLVVTKLQSDEACHAAYVKGSLKDANAKARALADKSGSFNCAEGIPEVAADGDIRADDIAVGFPCSAGQ